MDALVHLVENIPDWIKRLDDLNGQVEKRQMELAALDDPQNGATGQGAGAGPVGPKSVKNKGSTESLEPVNESAAHCHPPPIEPAIQAAGQAGKTRARNTLRKRPRPESVLSVQGAPRYRSRTMILVYYDSYVQTFFEDLVNFVSASRNQMRKAKMAAKVAQIRRLAELETADEEGDEDGVAGKKIPELVDGAGLIAARWDGPAMSAAPLVPDPSLPLEAGPIEDEADDAPTAVQYRSTRGAKAAFASGRPVLARVGGPLSFHGVGEQPGVYDALDSGLEEVQSMCEKAAHQFLRDGDCAADVDEIERRLAETGEAAAREMDRMRREEPEALRAAEEEAGRGRVHRPLRMAKDGGASVKARELPAAVGNGKLEVDEAVDDLDDDVPLPPILYRSTRRVW